MNHLTPPAVHCPKKRCGRYIGQFYGTAQCRTCGTWVTEVPPKDALWVDTPTAVSA